MRRRQSVRIEFFWSAIHLVIRFSDWARRAAPAMLLIGALVAGAAVWLASSAEAGRWVWKGWERMFGSPSTMTDAVSGALAQSASAITSGNYTITAIDAPSAGASALEATLVFAVNASGAMTGGYSDAAGVIILLVISASAIGCGGGGSNGGGGGGGGGNPGTTAGTYTITVTALQDPSAPPSEQSP